MPWGAVFDWDGVIINSAAHHEASWERLAQELGKALPPDHFKKGFGMKNEWIIPNLLGWTTDPAVVREWSLRKEELYREVIRERGIDALPGVRQFLASLQAAGIPRVIGSSTHRLNITTTLQALGLEHAFTDLVTAEDVLHGKPDPEVFLKAAEKIAVPADRCCVFEDAHVGIAAARAAGMRVVALPTTHPRATLTDADLVAERLDTIPPALWEEWFGPRQPAAAGA
jgi:HAD superfamily hydrolase (TIGR01509 family)